MTKPALPDIVLTGWRNQVRRLLFGSTIGLSIIGAIGYVLPAHQLEERSCIDGECVGGFHGNYADGGVVPLVGFLAVCLITWALRRRGFGAGFVSGFVAIGGGVVAIASVILVHLLANVTLAYGETVFCVGAVGLLLVGVIQLVGEPILHALERFGLPDEPDERGLPTAYVVRT